jgi:hypothetical protein
MPAGVNVDIFGNLYVADYSNNRVLQYNNPLTDQVADRVFGQPDFSSNTCNNGGRSASSLCRPLGIDAEQTGPFPQTVLFVADGRDGISDNSRVLVFNDPISGDTQADWILGQPDFTTGGCNSVGINASSLCTPFSVMAAANAGSVFVADGENNRVLRYDLPLSSDTIADAVYGQSNFTTNACNTGGISSVSMCRPSSLWLSPSQDRMLVVEQTNNRLLSFYNPLGDATADRVFGQGGSFTSGVCNLGGLSAQSLCNPNGVSMDAGGNVYVSDTNNLRVLIYEQPFDPDSDGLASEIDNCPTSANPGQEDGDGDAVGDVCDNCPAVSNSAQTDTDVDTIGNSCDNCPSISNIGQDNQDEDEYGDACEAPQCVTVVNHWAVPAGDDDCDGYPSSVAASGKAPESSIGTLTLTKCAVTAGPNNEPLPDAWPVDFNDDQKATILDVATFSAVFGSMSPGPPYNVRHDFNADGKITILDVAQYSAFFGKSCSPLGLDGGPARIREHSNRQLTAGASPNGGNAPTISY